MSFKDNEIIAGFLNASAYCIQLTLISMLDSQDFSKCFEIKKQMSFMIISELHVWNLGLFNNYMYLYDVFVSWYVL